MLSIIRSALNLKSSSDGVCLATEALENLRLSDDPSKELVEWKETIFDIIRSIKDPEKNSTLGDLSVVQEDHILVRRDIGAELLIVRIEIVPTVPHCSFATLIGLCIVTKLNRELPPGRFKVDLHIKEGSHLSWDEITKQINDKERVAAALENPALLQTVETCIREDD